MPWTLYILECRGKTLYTGITNDLAKRLASHAAGRGARYTRSHLPVRLVYQERCRSRGNALQKEYALKQLPRKAKLALIAAAGRPRRIKLTKCRTEAILGPD